jgi:hypothetical protein
VVTCITATAIKVGVANRLPGHARTAAAAAAAAAVSSLKIRPKNISRHGRQNVYDGSGQRHFFNIGKVREHEVHDEGIYYGRCYMDVDLRLISHQPS